MPDYIGVILKDGKEVRRIKVNDVSYDYTEEKVKKELRKGEKIHEIYPLRSNTLQEWQD